MSAEELFVRRFDDLVLGLKARDDYEIVKVGAILRQLLLDDTPLIHKANRQHRLKLRFVVNDISSKELPIQPDVHFVASGLDPSMLALATGTKRISMDHFFLSDDTCTSVDLKNYANDASPAQASNCETAFFTSACRSLQAQ